MSDVEALLRSTLADHAADISPDPDAVAAAVAAVQRRQQLRQQRRQQRRRVTAVLAAAATAVAIAVVVVVATAVGHGTSQPDLSTRPATGPVTSPPAAAAPTSSPPSAITTSAPSTTDTGSVDRVSIAIRRIGIINTVLGPDYSGPARPTSGWGDLNLTLGSPSAAGLPAGYNAAATATLMDPMTDIATGPVDTLTQMCQGGLEKGATTKPCVTEVKNGVTVYRSDTDAPNTKIGTWANLRIIYKRPDQLVAYTQITIYNTNDPTTAQERAAAATWLNNQEDKLTLAATTGP